MAPKPHASNRSGPARQFKFVPKTAGVIRLRIALNGAITVNSKQARVGLRKLIASCTECGPTIDGVKITFEDPLDPIVIFILEAEDEDGKDFTTSFRIQKSDMYIVSYLLGVDLIGGTWNVFEPEKSKFYTDNQIPTKFPHTYFRDKDRVIMENKGGALRLLKALKQLHDGKIEKLKREAFQYICYHLSECARFRAVWRLVVRRMDAGYHEESVAKATNDLIRSWESKSRLLTLLGINTNRELLCGSWRM